MPNRDEIDRQFALEYGRPGEALVRFGGVLFGSGLLYLYTGWDWALAWGAIFLLVHLVYYLFLRSRGPLVSDREVLVSHLLFLAVVVAFIWLPGVMISARNPHLMVIGASLVGCILVFLVRRSDTPRLMMIGVITVVCAIAAIVYSQFVFYARSPIERVGTIAAGLALAYYFAMAMIDARRLRLEGKAVAARAAQAEKLAAVGQLAGGVAHDFNNNLTAIMGNLELLALPDLDAPTRRACLDDAQVAARQAAATVRQLLVYARRERVTLVRQDASARLDDITAEVRRRVPPGIAVEVRRTTTPLPVRADGDQLATAVLALAANARDAMPKGGTILLSSTRATFLAARQMADGTMLPPGDYAAITCADTGDGIPEAVLPRVLDPFFTTRPVGQGAGLGLPTVLGTTRDLGGGLAIDSTAAGTRVTIYLPLVRSP